MTAHLWSRRSLSCWRLHGQGWGHVGGPHQRDWGVWVGRRGRHLHTLRLARDESAVMKMHSVDGQESCTSPSSVIKFG